MQIQVWDLDRIIPYENNAKLHNVDWIAKSISEFKIDQPIVVDKDGVIIKGHGRYKAAMQLGLKEFPVVVREDLTELQIKLSRIADNRTNEGGWDTNLLHTELNTIFEDMPDFDFNSLGITDEWTNGFEIQDALNDIASKDTKVDPDSLDDFMFIKLKYSFDEYQEINDKLSTLQNTPEVLFKKAVLGA